LIVTAMAAARKSAESTLYHLSPKGFWKKFRDTVVVNPEISSGLPLPSLNRYPQPASRPERYATPATKASDPAQNPYWKRDVRRAFPYMSVVTQAELSNFLLQKPEQPAVAAPEAEKTDATAVSNAPKPAVDLTSAIATVSATTPVFSQSKLPPSFTVSYPRWIPQDAPDAPHDPAAYFPMILVK